MIARSQDSLPLCAYMGEDSQASALESSFPEYRAQLKGLTKTLANQTEPMCSLEVNKVKEGAFTFHILLADYIGFICLCDKSYPKKLAFSFLSDLHKNFLAEFSSQQVHAANKPYAFIKFESIIQRLTKSFQDSRAKQNIARLQE